MANPIWDGLVTYLTFVTTSTNSFNIPVSTGAVTFILPTLTTDLTVTVQGLDPRDKTTWRNVEAYNPAAGIADEVEIASNTYTVVPASALGMGTFRLTAPATSQAGVICTVLIDRI